MQTEFVPGIKSRPVYGPVTINPHSLRQIFISEGHITQDLLSLYDGCQQGEKTMLAAGVAGDASAGGEVVSLEGLSDYAATLPQSSSFYLAGTEAFMWDLAGLLNDAGFINDQIHMLPPVSNERRLFCTHCYTLMEPVTRSPHTCTGCGRELLVRDHFSRIHRAYVGVQINAEDPADLPAEPEELS